MHETYPFFRRSGHARFRAVLALLVLSSPGSAVASPTADGLENPDWFVMAMGLFGGLALFLFGMEQMGDALKATAGDRMKQLLMRLTKNRVMAATTGALVTAVIQSSSVTTVLVVGFVSAGLMSMTQSIGIILGANVGTTLTAHIVAFKVTEYALLLVAVGFAASFFGKAENVRRYGNLLMGLGLIFFGMGVMSEGMAPLRSYQPFIDLMVAMEQPLLAILVAGGFTALVQSSSATSGIIIVMATQGFVTLPAGIAMALGANIGTCATALLAAIGKSTEAVRVAAVHVVFNVVGVILWLGFIDQLADLAVWMSPAHADLPLAERLAAETPRQIANANTAFNLINMALFLLFAGSLARLVTVLVPERAESARVLVEPRFLSPELIGTPALALNAVRLETGHMGSFVLEMLALLRPATVDRDLAALQRIAQADDRVDLLQQRIYEYLAQVRGAALTDADTADFQQLVNGTAYIENAGDVVANEFVPLVRDLIQSNVPAHETVKQTLELLGEQVAAALKDGIAALAENDQRKAESVVARRAQIEATVERILGTQAKTLDTARASNIAQLRRELEFIDKLRRIYSLANRMAGEVLPREIALKSQ
ncbi:MAG: Na/Pi cotransporter family protein [Pseudomonadales bacterium]|jgi:phosphate:Na+ symporter|nr:Na/Pi cotransporter family protein [Pseudomonadales bacterium]